MGNPWSGILQFLSATDNAPEVQEMFKSQLEQREKIRFKIDSQHPKEPYDRK
jgi:fibrillarin-like rRNA methylase